MIYLVGFYSSGGTLQQCSFYALTPWAHWCCRAIRQWSDLWHLPQVPRHWKAYIQQSKPSNFSGHIIFDHVSEIRWCHQCWRHRVSNKFGAIPTNPLHAVFLRPSNIRSESIPRADVCVWDHKCSVWASKHDGQMWPPAWQVHGMLLNVSWGCCAQGCQCCCCHNQDQENCAICWLVGFSLSFLSLISALN